MGEEEREPLLSPRAANVLTSQASEMDDGAAADKKTSSQRLRRREKQHGYGVGGARVKEVKVHHVKNEDGVHHIILIFT